ncbi:hypothetical protein FGG08_006561 [Glutinoglossum americanum]|uniref:Importin N-terminal domain-containing protein n=1 Tax=Glutinoglossum americanum TaxID=1670608 RepID=A0A9P8L088_9PEZI|nr:hypothetical protein FGG08_006561 [Glutinoglossum americanum]
MEAIELPAEANPLTPANLFNVLTRAVSTHQQQVQTGAQQLQAWEAERGYYCMLQNVFIDKSLPLEIRYLAIIQLKNGIDKYWRKHALNSIHKEDKAIIRSQSLESGVSEPDQRLALQNALVISKIVRYDYPTEWPDVISSMIVFLRKSSQDPKPNPIYLPRTLLILLHIIKELTKVRLQKSRANLQLIAPEILNAIGQVYVDKVQGWKAFLEGGGEDEGGAIEDIEQSLLAIRVIRRLLTAGYEFPNRGKDVREFWIILRTHFGYFLDVVMREPQILSDEVQRLVENHLIQIAKLHLNMARGNATAFALLPDSVALLRAYWGLISKFGETFGSKTAITSLRRKPLNAEKERGDDTPILERLCLKGLLLLRACVKMVFYPAQSIRYRHAEEKDEQRDAKEMLKTQLLTDDLVREIVEVVVTRFFVFRGRDLQEWQEEPEEWERTEEGEGDAWEFAVRPCCEKLFLELVINHKDLLIPPLLSVFASVSTPEVENIIFKDSVYTAIGLSAPVLYNHLDFDSFLASTLVAEVQKKQPGYNILRRRIAVLIGQWVTVKIASSSRVAVYQIFQHILDKDDPLNDLVVRITAGKQFKNAIDDWDFEIDRFVPYLPGTLGRIMSLIEEVELTETKMALLDVVSVIVGRLGQHVSPYVEQIISMLPPLWAQAGEEHLLKQSILTIFIKLVESMGVESQQFHSLVLPLIKMTLEPGSETQVYLLEDALDLWEAILKRASSPPPTDLLSLAPYVFPIFETGTLTLRKALSIVESYILLAPTEMLSNQMRGVMFTSFASIFGTLKPEANGIVAHLVEIVVRAADSLGGEQAVEIVGSGLVESGFLAKLHIGLRGSWEAHQTTGPKSKHPPIDGVVETDYFNVLARLALTSTRIFVTVLQAVETSLGQSFEGTMEWLLTEWFSHFGNIGHPIQRKLNCMALTRLLETNQKWILGRMQDLMTVWTDVLIEVVDNGVDCLVWSSERHAGHDDMETPEDARLRELTITDATRKINVKDFIKHHLQQAIMNCGGQEAFHSEWLINVDRDVVNDFSKLDIF